MKNIDDLLRQRLVVCMGSGGVGKTTIAAALAVAAARAGRDTAVITVDPARRLKDALGIDELSVDPQRVPLSSGGAMLDALALDTKRTFDALIERVASADVAERIFANRLYQEMSSGLGGSAEYMAMEKLHELLDVHTYDMIIVDTPPSAHARDLLGAPMRLSELLASSAVRILKTPSSILGGRKSGAARAALRGILAVLERWTGVNLLQELADFATNFETLVEGFRERAEEVETALRRADTSFVVVTTPEEDTVRSALGFCRELAAERFHLAGILANRVHAFPGLDADAALHDLPAALQRKLQRNYSEIRALTRHDERALDRLHRQTHAPVLGVVPVLRQPPSSLAGLESIADALRGAGGRGLGARGSGK